nr:MAG TPA: hypothetical protein [Caudoviricetes sp.]
MFPGFISMQCCRCDSERFCEFSLRQAGRFPRLSDFEFHIEILAFFRQLYNSALLWKCQQEIRDSLTFCEKPLDKFENLSYDITRV